MKNALCSTMQTVHSALAIGLSHLPAPRFVREQVNAETSIDIFTMLVPGPYERVQAACRVVAAHYPVPAWQTLDRLAIDLASGQSTALTQDFYREYGKEQTK